MGMAKSADEALEKIDNEKPDLVLLDIHILGDLDGTELALKIRKLYGLPYIYITSYSDADTLAQMTATKPLGYILKPFDKRDIRVALQLGFSRIDTKEVSNTGPEITQKEPSNSKKANTLSSNIIGESKVIQEALKQIKQVRKLYWCYRKTTRKI